MKKILIFFFFFLPVLLGAQERAIDYAPLNAAVKENLINLININTAQPEPDETLAARYIYKVLNKNNIDWDIYRAEKPRANLIAVLKADKKAPRQDALIMLAHLDTAAVHGEWANPPAKAVLKDGRIYGLGSSDAKNYAAVNLAIMTWLKQNKVRLNRDIIFLFTADEENGSAKGIRFLYDKYPQKLKAGYALNEGGGFTDEGRGSIMFVEAATKMYMDILITAYGEDAHSAAPADNNAIYKLSQALSKIEAYNPPLHAAPFTIKFFEKVYPLQDDDAKTTMAIFLNSSDYMQRAQAARIISEDRFFKTQLMDTISPTVITAGAQSNTVSSEAYATLNCRLLPDTDPARFLAALTGLFDNDDSITLTVTERPQLPFPQPDPSGNDPLLRSIERAVGNVNPGALTLAGIGPAASESEFLRRRGVITYGIGPRMDRDGGGGPHQVDESIAEEDLYHQLKLTLNIVLDFAEYAP
ncbi:MAG: M20/M25/M40 family metallo-hydrolase [Elusimicrobiota bacterium]|jgi:acetylornithine deacetylase/succinyl-diaminopimelate desuccinylase-like protein|nr:M20/M25/M40 family metallo-hydrolase [Elusimicrobiota bacterium]